MERRTSLLKNFARCRFGRTFNMIVMIIRDILLVVLSFWAGVIITFNYLDKKDDEENKK